MNNTNESSKLSSTAANAAELIANQLGETKPGPRAQIRSIVWALGAEQTRQLAQRAQEIEAEGGMMLANGTRRRTIGGVFFELCYSEGKPREGRRLQRPTWHPKGKQQAEDETVSDNRMPTQAEEAE